MSKQELIDLIKNKEDADPPYYELEHVLTLEEQKKASKMIDLELIARIEKLDINTLQFLLFRLIKTTPHIEDDKYLIEHELVDNNDVDIVFNKLIDGFTEDELQNKIELYTEYNNSKDDDNE